MSLRIPRVDADLRKPLTVVVGLVLLLCCGGLGLGGFFIFRPEQDPGVAVRIAADAFVSRLVAGNYGGAYDQLCADIRERLDRDEFVTSVGGRPAVRSYQVEKIEAVDGGYSVSVTLADPTGATEAQVLRVVEDRGTWRVCGEPLQAQ